MKKTLKICLIIFCVLFATGVLFGFIFISNIMRFSDVKFDKNKLLTISQEVVVYDNNNELVTSKSNEKTTVNIENIPNNVINAFISIEDKNFFNHNGLNYKRIVKAMINNIKSGSFKEGASTISQQLIKNTHLTNEKTISRKIKEIVLTKKLEKEFNKKDILETYLNVIYFGENAYGIEQASKTYFNKSCSDLTLCEGATLAGIIKSPYTYSPVYNYDNCLTRRNLVLREMYRDGKITQIQYEDAVSMPLEISSKTQDNNANDLYVKACINEAKNILNLTDKELRSSGIKIYSYLDLETQNLLFNIANNLENYHENSYGNTNDSLLILINNKTYGVSGFAGKSKYDLTDFKRQPGSAIKPILVYAPALEFGLISPQSLIFDEEIDYNGYNPKNVGGKYFGYVSVEDCICESLNVPAVKVLDYVGINKAKSFAQNVGITFNKSDTGLALALGGFTEGVNLKDLTTSYLPFANSGKFDNSHFINKIFDKDGKLLYEHKIKESEVMGEDTAYLMTDMLHTATQKGTSKKLKTLPFDVAGKTGTVAIKGTNNNTDAYSIAYTTDHTMGVWIGNYSNDERYVLEGKNNGGTYATNMINLAFSSIYENQKPDNFKMPSSVSKIDIDLKEYETNHAIKLASNNCPERYKSTALVSNRFMPKEKSDLFDVLGVKDFNAIFENNSVKITFNAEDYLQYEIVKVNHGNTKILKKISNKNNSVVFYDTNIKQNDKYDYYIKISTIDNGASSVSETIKIIIPSKEEKLESLLNKQDNISWLFG